VRRGPHSESKNTNTVEMKLNFCHRSRLRCGRVFSGQKQGILRYNQLLKKQAKRPHTKRRCVVVSVFVFEMFVQVPLKRHFWNTKIILGIRTFVFFFFFFLFSPTNLTTPEVYMVTLRGAQALGPLSSFNNNMLLWLCWIYYYYSWSRILSIFMLLYWYFYLSRVLLKVNLSDLF